MTRLDIRNDVLRRVWFNDPANAPSNVLEDTRTAINKALQVLWLAKGNDFFTTEDKTVTVTAGNRSVALPSGIQEVKNVRLASSLMPLDPVFTLDDILYYRRRYEGALTESNGVPAAFFVENRRAEDDDAAGSTLYVAPTPASNTSLSVEVRGEAPVYTLAELESDSETIAVAHAYVEHLFLPVARYEATRFSWFKDREDLRASLREDAAAAMVAHGLAVPWPETRNPAKEVAAAA